MPCLKQVDHLAEVLDFVNRAELELLRLVIERLNSIGLQQISVLERYSLHFLLLDLLFFHDGSALFAAGLSRPFRLWPHY